MAKKEKIINSHKRKRIYRKYISIWESRFAVFYLGFLIVAIGWVLSKRTDFDPKERNISYEVLLQKKAKGEIYNVPFKAWIEPGTALSGQVGPSTGILPPAILSDGWKLKGRVKYFLRDNLYEKINGAAESFLKLGFQKLTYLIIANQSAEISIELYDQGTLAGVMGIYAAQRGDINKIENKGDVFFHETSLGAIGIKPPFYFKVVASPMDLKVRVKVNQLVELFNELPAKDLEVPFGYKYLMHNLKRPFESVSYVAKEAFQLGIVNDIWFSQVPGQKEKVFIKKSTAKEVVNLFNSFIKESKDFYSPVMKSKESVILKHSFLNTFLGLYYFDGYFFGVEGMESQSETKIKMEKMLKELKNAQK